MYHNLTASQLIVLTMLRGVQVIILLMMLALAGV